MRLLACLLALALLGGCALSPQSVSIDPVITPAVPGVGRGPAVELRGEDARGNPVIGIRGGVYKTSEIRPANDIGEAVRARAAQGLAAQGYAVEPGAGTRVTLSVEQLSYQPQGGAVITGADISATLRALAERGDTRLETRYNSTLTRKFPVAPTAAQNEAWLNEVLGDTLQRFLDDGRVRSFLTAP